jgi:hypothetical protein
VRQNSPSWLPRGVTLTLADHAGCVTMPVKPTATIAVASETLLIFLTIYDRYGMIPVNDVLTGPLFVNKDTAKEVIELSAQGYR